MGWLQFKQGPIMQLTKGNHYEEHSNFHEQLLLQDPPSPQHPPFPQLPLKHQLPPSQQPPPLLTGDDNELRFYQEFRKIYTVAHHLALEKRRQVNQWEALNKRIRTMEDRMKEAFQRKNITRDQIEEENRTKRSRRTAEEIEKRFKCEVPYCERLYGSEGSLQQHIKLKHPQLYHRSQSEDSLLPQGDSSL